MLLTLAKVALEPFKKYDNATTNDSNSPTAYYSGVPFESDHWIKVWSSRSNGMHRDLISVKSGQRKSDLEAKRYVDHADWEKDNFALTGDKFVREVQQELTSQFDNTIELYDVTARFLITTTMVDAS